MLSASTKRKYIFSALAYMGHASNKMSWANNCVEVIEEVPEELKAEMKAINAEVHRLQEKLRTIQNAISE